MKTEQAIQQAVLKDGRSPGHAAPHALRRIFGAHAPAIHRLMAADPGLADFVARQDKAGIHFLALAVSHHLPDRRAGLRDMAVLLRTLERAKLLRRILGRRPPPGLTGVLGKLGAAPMPAESYRRLVELLDEPAARKALTHARRITRTTLDGLAHLPPALRMLRLAAIAGKPLDRERLDYALAAVRRNRPDLDDTALRASLKAVKDADDVHRWLDHLLTRLPFATPPWEGDGQLRPVRNRRELKEVAGRFRNCLAGHHMLDAVLGRKFFYVWEGGEPCVVEVSPDDLVGWRIGEIEGVDNTAPGPETRARVVTRLARHGIAYFGESGIGVWDDFL
jgi:hypothetical protein